MRPRFLDVLAVLVSLLVVASLAVWAYGNRTEAREVVIEARGSTWVYPLDSDRREMIPGPLGYTVVVIRGGRAWVEDSPCPDKLCAHMPAISQSGQWIACLPNRVFVRVKGGRDADIDQLSY